MRSLIASRRSRTRRRRPGPRPGVLIVVVVVALYLGLLVFYAVAGRTTAVEADVPPGGVHVILQVDAIDPSAQHVSLAVDMIPDPAFVEEDDFTLAEQLTLVIDPSAGSRQITYPEGQVPSVTRVDLIINGDIRTWPLDRYDTELVVGVYSGPSEDHQMLTTRVSIDGSLHGWRLAAEERGAFEGIEELRKMYVNLRRSGATLVFAGILLATLAAMPVLTMFVASRSYSGRRAVQPTYMSWMAAMLFATIPLRNFLPGSPPPGSWIDAIVVLWVVVALVASLALYVVAWWRQSEPPPSRA